MSMQTRDCHVGLDGAYYPGPSLHPFFCFWPIVFPWSDAPQRIPYLICRPHFICRDINDRGRDLDSVLTQYERFVKPSYESFIAPQRSYADVVIPRGKDNVVGISMVIEALRTLLVEHEVANI